MIDWWHFHVWKQFNKKIFKQTLTEQDICSRLFFLPEVNLIGEDGVIGEEWVNKQVVKIEKNGKLYIMLREDIEQMPLNPIKTVECYLKESDKTVYNLILEAQTARIKPEKTKTFKEFIIGFNPVEHNNPWSKAFMNLLMIATKHRPTKIALCSESSSGKTSVFNILKTITNDVCIQRTPTLAKLETVLFYSKVLLLEELSSLTSSEVRQIEPVIFVGGDGSPEMEKHSMATHKIMNTIDLSEISFIFPHNRPQDLQTDAKFMMDIWKNPAAFTSRFPCILIEGKVLSKISTPNKATAIKTMEEHYQEMLEVAKNTLYFIKNIDKEMHYFERRELHLLDARQYPNIEGLVDVIDAFCETQIEFDEWINYLNNCMIGYQDMLRVSRGIEKEEVVQEERI